MSQDHVNAVFGPPHVQGALKYERAKNRQAELIILSLRRLLREHNPELPNVYDGTAWMEIENVEAPPELLAILNDHSWCS